MIRRSAVLVALFWLFAAVPTGAGEFDILVQPDLIPCMTTVPQAPIFATVQAAVDAAASGQTIGVCPGTYVENVLVNMPSLTLLGIGNSRLVSPGGSGDGFLVTAHDVTIQGFEVSDFNADSASCGIQVFGADRARIQNSVFAGNSNGLCMEGSEGSRLSHNTVRDSGHVPSGSGDGILVLFSSKFAIENNQVTGSRVMGIRLVGIEGFDVHHNLVADSVVYGIDLFNYSAFGGGSIRNNTIRLNGFHVFGGILVNATVGVIIERNSLLRNTGHGLTILNSSDCRILRNNVGQNGGDGIAADSLTNCLVSHNTVQRNTGNGIRLTSLGSGDVISFNAAAANDAEPADPGVFDCNWDGSDAPVFLRNVCRTDSPPGAWD